MIGDTVIEQEQIEIASSEELMAAVVAILYDLQAEDITVLDLKEVDGSPANYFVIASGNSDVHMHALGDSVQRRLKVHSGRVRNEGKRSTSWVLIDYFDVVVHIMSRQARDFYRLEKVWGDAPKMSVDAQGVLKPIE